jgi:hypothetical protein
MRVAKGKSFFNEERAVHPPQYCYARPSQLPPVNDKGPQQKQSHEPKQKIKKHSGVMDRKTEQAKLFEDANQPQSPCIGHKRDENAPSQDFPLCSRVMHIY